MLAIGDGANDVAMIQAADVGIGIAGKEGRQAVNNSDYAISQFRFITRLLLVHGQVSRYRLGRLIKYSFYKNSCFAGVLIFFQIYNGFSGQTLVDDISAAVYNVIFTSLPILFFSLLDRPCEDLHTLLKYPRTYQKTLGLSVKVFWKTSVLHVRAPCPHHLLAMNWCSLQTLAHSVSAATLEYAAASR
jgi:phospholipid-transporting ATPase